jgi:hypothetical protein
MTGIARGFRRLSVFAAAAGVTMLTFLWLSDGGGAPSFKQLLTGLALFGGFPAILVLLLGWVVAGFRISE